MTRAIVRSFVLAALTAAAGWAQLTVSCTLTTGPVEVAVPYSNTCTAAGGTPPYAWTIVGSNVPSGLTGSITPTGNPATIAYTPTSALANYQYLIVAIDSLALTGNKLFTGTIAAAVAITTTSPLPGALAGTPYTQQFGATAGVSPYSWTATGQPSWLTMSTTGLLSGTPPSAGTVTFTATVTDLAGGTSSGSFSFTVTAPLTITTNSPLPAGMVGVTYSQTLTATGGSGPYTWAVTTGTLPPVLTLNPATGVIGGTPTTAGTSSFTVQVSDSTLATATKAFTLTINPALAITTVSPLPPGTVNVSYSQTLTATGGSGPYTWTVTTGTLPPVLTLNPTTGVISGTPTTAGTSTFTIQVTDSKQATASAVFTLTIVLQLTITTSSPLANGIVGVVYNQALAGTGGTPPYTWSLAPGSSLLPGGLTLSSAGLIGGTPTTAGAFPFTVQLTDSAIPANTVTKPLVITVSAGLTITTAPTLPNATVGVAYSQTLSAAGGTAPYTWSITAGTPPASLSLSTAGVITGMPAAPGTFTFTVQVVDVNAVKATQQFTLTVVSAPVINTASPLPNGAVGIPYSQTLAASGGTPPYLWAVSTGSLPAGLSLSTGGSFAGTPSAPGTFTFTVQLTDAAGVTATKAFTLTILTGLNITTTSPLPSGEVGILYSQTLIVTGGASPYTWSVTAGTPPPGLILSPTGTLTGTPTAAGTFNFTVQAADSNHTLATATFALTIQAALGISTPASLNGGSVGSSYSQSLAASGGVGPFTWALTAGLLPAGLNLSTNGAITGIPTAAGTYAFTVKVVDSLGATATRQFTIVVAVGLTITTPATLPNATVGIAYTYLLLASGGTAPYTWTNPQGSPPTGISLGSNGSLTGVPTVAGTFNFKVQVTDSLGHQASQQISLTSPPPLIITPIPLSNGAVGVPYSQSLAVTGGTPPYSWSIQGGALPGGLSLTAAGTIAGTPSASGTFSFTVGVADSASATATKRLSIAVAGGLTVTTAGTLPNAFINASYSQNLAAAGGTPPYTWALTSGALPAGLTLTAAGLVSGTPTAAGTFNFTATVTDSASGTASQQFTLVVGGGLSISTTSLPGGQSGTPYSQTLTATGGTPPYTFTVSAGSLPPGITLNGANLSGTPTKTGSYTFTIQVSDSILATATQQFTIAITGLAITSPALPGAAVGTPYTVTLLASGSGPFTWAITQGALPGGLKLDPSTGTIAGTPTVVGTSSATIQVTDSTKATASAAFTLTVISASFGGLSTTATAAQQLTGTLALGAAYPQDISGAVTLTFQPDAALASPADDPAIQFSAGGRTANFTIPANSTAPVSFLLQTGTVAGAITLTVTWQAGGTTLPTPAALTQIIQISPAVPVIGAVTATATSSGFQVVITGYSNTRELSQAVLQFAPAAGQTLQTTSLTVSLTSAATTWFQSGTSDQYGSQFILTLPFTVGNGAASAIGSVSVQLVNSQGSSTSASATL